MTTSRTAGQLRVPQVVGGRCMAMSGVHRFAFGHRPYGECDHRRQHGDGDDDIAYEFDHERLGRQVRSHP